MNARLVKLGERGRSNLWLIPGLCMALAIGVAVSLVDIEQSTNALRAWLPWTFAGGAESARAVLSMIAGSTITLAATLYSITFVVLVLASQQFAPRVLRGFMRDRSNQMVLGFFVATFTYCLLVLRSVRSTSEGEFVPHVAVTLGMGLALVSLGMLVYFIDHLSHAIHVSSLLANVVKETLDQIDRLYPRPWQGAPRRPARRGQGAPAGAEVGVPAAHSGYLQYVDYRALLGIARRHACRIRVDHLVGDFVIAGTPLVFVSPAGPGVGALTGPINAGFALGTSPTLQEDIGYGVRQIVDVALKAISPAVNDPTTAVNCIDQLAVILGVLAGREMPERDLTDGQGVIRVQVRERTYADLARLAFAQITHFGAGDPVIVLRMARRIDQIAAVTASPGYREALQAQLDQIAAAAQRSIQDPAERAVVATHLRMAGRPGPSGDVADAPAAP